MSLSLLVIDDDISIRETLVEFFETFGYTVRGAATATEGRRLAADSAPDVVLLDLHLPDADGLVTIGALLADDPDLGILLLTGHADVRVAVRAMQQGAVDVLEKPVDLEVLQRSVVRAAELGRMRRELELLRARSRGGGRESRGPHRPDEVPLVSRTLEQLVDLAARNADAPVLLQGETGTGKGYVARQIHDRSARNQAPFVEINCASLASSFLESELFGHERGAFTDAKTAKRGLLEVAGNGTVFLDEIAELPADSQPKLLKTVEDRTFRRLGGTTVLRTDARIIVATHEPLADAVAERRFRADLFYRFQVLTLTLPPLRARPEEIPALAARLLPHGASLTADAIDALVAYGWPGNIRELKNTLWRASILADGRPVMPEHLGLPGAGLSGGRRSGTASLQEIERAAIRAALHEEKGNRTRAAVRLGIARSTLNEKLKRME